MHIQHDPGARPPAPRPCLLVAGASGAGRGEAAPRFLDAVDGGRPPTAGPALRWGWKRAWLAASVALLAGAGMVLNAVWPEREAPSIATELAPRPAAAAVDVAAPVRGPARIERLEMPMAPRPAAIAASAPAAGAAQARVDGPAAVAATAARGPLRSPTKRRQEAAVAADAAVPAASARTAAEALADPEPPQGLQADADAELLQAVMEWDQRHPPAPAPGRAVAPAARASSPP